MNFKKIFAKSIYSILKKEKEDLDINLDQILENIENPPNISLGHFSLPTFFLAKYLKKNPEKIAKDLLKKVPESKVFDFSEKNGYLNSKIKDSTFFKEIIRKAILEKEKYGKLENIDSKEYTIDTFNANPFKTLHIGHLRNIVIGDSIHRILKFANQKSHPISYGGDVGTHVAKWYWYYSNMKDKSIPKENISKWFGQIYIKAGEKLFNNPKLKKEVDNIQKKINEDENLQKEIKKLRNICFKGYMDIKEELNVFIEESLFESQAEKEFYKVQEEIFNNYLDLFYKSEGAYIADLKKYALDILVLIKNNGSLLYGAKDIGLINIKKKLFSNSNNFLYVVGAEQKHYFKQLIKLFSIIYPKTYHKHIAYGLVNLDKKKMSSRKGGLILYEDFRDLLTKKVKKKLKENKLVSNKKILEKIVNGVIKFEMLKTTLSKTLSFNMEHALDLQGDSVVYLQYSGVRAKSILNKVQEKIDISKLEHLKTINLEKEEEKLLYLILNFKNKIKKAYLNFNPIIINNYCLELAHCFSRFYTNCEVLVSNEKTKYQRLLLTKVYLIVLENALNLLGIKIPEKM